MMTALRKALPYLFAFIGIAAIYDAWLFYSRWSDGRDAERAEQHKQADLARRSLQLAGGAGFKITTFYASPTAVHRGEPAKLCYGMLEAKAARIAPPPADEVYPALSRCVEVAPAKTTEYTLTAEDGAGHSATQTVTLSVTP